jgi:hypothetical protein
LTGVDRIGSIGVCVGRRLKGCLRFLRHFLLISRYFLVFFYCCINIPDVLLVVGVFLFVFCFFTLFSLSDSVPGIPKGQMLRWWQDTKKMKSTEI